MKPGSYKAPFTADGHLLHYAVEGSSWYGAAEWRENEPFEAVLTLGGMARGRSAAFFTWTDEDGHVFSMFMTDLVTLLRYHRVEGGQTPLLRWSVRKRGCNYGIAVHKEGR